MEKGLSEIEKIIYPIDDKIIRDLHIGKRSIMAYFDVIKVKEAVKMLKEMIRNNETIDIEQMEEMLDLVDKAFPIFEIEDRI